MTAARRPAPAAALSLAWRLGRAAVTSVIIGARSVAQLSQNLAAAALRLPDGVVARLDDLAAPPPRYPESFLARSSRAG